MTKKNLHQLNKLCGEIARRDLEESWSYGGGRSKPLRIVKHWNADYDGILEEWSPCTNANQLFKEVIPRVIAHGLHLGMTYLPAKEKYHWFVTDLRGIMLAEQEHRDLFLGCVLAIAKAWTYFQKKTEKYLS